MHQKLDFCVSSLLYSVWFLALSFSGMRSRLLERRDVLSRFTITVWLWRHSTIIIWLWGELGTANKRWSHTSNKVRFLSVSVICDAIKHPESLNWLLSPLAFIIVPNTWELEKNRLFPEIKRTKDNRALPLPLLFDSLSTRGMRQSWYKDKDI